MNTLVQVFGSCFAEPSAISDLAGRGEWAALSGLPGSYSLAIRSGKTVALVGSAVAPANLFYTTTNDGLFFAPSAIDLSKHARIPWRWNWTALADFTALDHCVDGETIHANVKKVEPGSVVRFDGATTRSWLNPWSERVSHCQPSPAGAVDALLDSSRRYLDGDVVVSMSAGFDSRLLLACVLASGTKPRLITMGHAASTDVRVSTAIARKFDLRIDVVPLDASTYMQSGTEITRISGGCKGFQHWHTYTYARQAPLTSDSRIFIGSNGEAARSYYLDKGLASLAAEALASDWVKSAFWSRKLRPIFRPDELAMLHPRLAAALGPAGLRQRCQRLRELSPGPLLTGLDRFYTEQRVSNFISNGLSLVGARARTAAPMLHREWMSHVWNLPRSWKMDSKWHRYAIGRLCPALLEFEDEGTGRAMRGTPRPLYWLPMRRRRRATVSYMDYERLLRSEPLLQFIRDGREQIEPLAQPELLRLIFDRHVSGDSRMRAASFLVTMLFLLRCLREEGIDVVSD